MALKFAILTAGNIATHMAQTVSQMKDEGIECYAIAARSTERAAALAKRCGFAIAYGSYEALFEDEHVDLVYIGSPHSHHYEHAKAALEHGKHVLCEKPMTVNEAQAKELFALAKERGLLLLEATWTRFMPFVPALQFVRCSRCQKRTHCTARACGRRSARPRHLSADHGRDCAGRAQRDLRRMHKNKSGRRRTKQHQPFV